MQTTDPAGRVDWSVFDLAGRVVATIQNYDDGDPETGGSDEDVTVLTTYTPGGQVATYTAVNPTTNNQTTRYVYGTDVGGITPQIYDNNLLRAVIYPDSDDPADLSGDGNDAVYDRVEYCYNRLSEQVSMTDQNGTEHAYSFDGLGRPTEDCVTQLGTGIDGTVRRIARTYEVRGMVEHVTSYDDPDVGEGTALNDVLYVYNDFAQLAQEFQAHSGTVNVETTPHVDYTYSDGSDNTIRLLSVTYPNGRIVHYTYGDPGSDADMLSRVDSLCEDDPGDPGHPGDPLASYTYLGLATIVQTDYPQAGLTYSLGDAGNGYAGLDQWGRVREIVWSQYGLEVDHYRYGYDLAGNRVSKENVVAGNLETPVNLDEAYQYDALYRLMAMDRGNLVSGQIVDSVFAQGWDLDATGNFSGFQENSNGQGGLEIDQTRDHNAANQITSIDSSSSDVAYDAVGNMTSVPKSGFSGHFTLTYDAWNRMVIVADGQTTVATYSYDGQKRRVVKNTASCGEVRHYFFSSTWQVLEERVGTDTFANVQYTWGVRYIDDLVCRDRDTSETRDGALEERIYALQDANFNVTAIASAEGGILERYTFTAYGAAEYRDAQFGAKSASEFGWTVLYAGCNIDPETGFSLNRNRYYIPWMGIFPTEDPMQADINLYRYTFNNPTIYVDPSGLQQVYYADVVAKSFINGVGAIGNLNGRVGPSDLVTGTGGILLTTNPDPINNPWLGMGNQATDRLRLAAALWSRLPAFNQNPQTDRKIGDYRLYTRAKVTFCCEGNPWDSGDTHRY